MILNFNELNEKNIRIVGNKAYTLSVLKKNKFFIANGFVISTNYFDDYLRENKIINLDEIKKNVSEIIGLNKKIIVRSSANLEDGKNYSFAGIFESFIDVKIENLNETIIKIYNSVFSEKAKAYYIKNNIPQEKIKMGIIIQEFIEPEISGICFTKNPINSNEELIIEYSLGSNQEIVSGEKKAERIIFDKNLNQPENNNQNVEVKRLKTRLKTFIEIENLFKNPQDIEWGITKDNLIYIYQSRPIVISGSLNENEKIKISKDLIVLAHGTGLSAGIVSGKFKFLNTDLKSEDLVKSVTSEDIIFADRIRVDQIISIKKVAGVIVTETGILSHTAIQAREFGIPCVGGIYEKALFTEGQKITIDGSKGLIYEGDLEYSQLENFDINVINQNFPNYYNFQQIKNHQLEDFEFLYCIKDDKAMIYLPKVDDQQMIFKSIEYLSNEFNLKKENILINKIKIYDSPNASSSVYSYYEDYKKTLLNPEFKENLELSKKYMDSLDNTSFRKLGEEIRDKTHQTFADGCKLFIQFKNSKDVSKLKEAAELLDKSIKLTIMFSNVIVFSFGTYYLEKHLLNDKGTTLSDFFNDKNYSNKDIKEFSEILTHFKNTEMEALSFDSTTFIDIIDYIYENGYEEHVLQYKW